MNISHKYASGFLFIGLVLYSCRLCWIRYIHLCKFLKVASLTLGQYLIAPLSVKSHWSSKLLLWYQTTVVIAPEPVKYLYRWPVKAKSVDTRPETHKRQQNTVYSTSLCLISPLWHIVAGVHGGNENMDTETKTYIRCQRITSNTWWVSDASLHKWPEVMLCVPTNPHKPKYRGGKNLKHKNGWVASGWMAYTGHQCVVLTH